MGNPQPVVHWRVRLQLDQPSMTIICLGWGSLIWDQCRAAELPTRGGWHEDGPLLPIEFARVSKNGRLTLTITCGAKLVPVMWAELDADSLNGAIALLCKREGEKGGKPTLRSNIGQCPRGGDRLGKSEIDKWRVDKGFEQVIWTALQPRSAGANGELESGRILSCSEAVRYLDALPDDKAALASKYIRKTPHQIQTGYRPTLTAALDRRHGA